MENIIILVIVLAFIYFMDIKRLGAENKRFHEFAKSIKVNKIEEDMSIPLPEDENFGDEIVELDEVPPEQLIKELNDNHKS